MSSDKTTFPPKVRKRLEKARERLDYTSYGILSDIAREVGVRRQYVHSVIRDVDTFEKHHSETAKKIWFCLERKLEEDKRIPNVERVVTSLRRGEPYQIKMGSRLFIFLTRRFKRLGIKAAVSKDDAAPATYTFVPELPETAPARGNGAATAAV